jgi:hypothetical protein
MTGFAYPPDAPAAVRDLAARWRAAQDRLGSAAGAVRIEAATAAAAWQGLAARSAVAVLDRTAARHDEAAASMGGAAGVVDRYADAVEQARAEVGRLNAGAASAAETFVWERRAASDLPDDGASRATRLAEAAASYQASMGRLRSEHAAVLARLAATAGALGAQLAQIAENAVPARLGPDRGPVAVVAQNAGDTGEVDWITDLAVNHPNLAADQRLWVMAHLAGCQGMGNGSTRGRAGGLGGCGDRLCCHG